MYVCVRECAHVCHKVTAVTHCCRSSLLGNLRQTLTRRRLRLNHVLYKLPGHAEQVRGQISRTAVSGFALKSPRSCRLLFHLLWGKSGAVILLYKWQQERHLCCISHARRVSSELRWRDNPATFFTVICTQQRYLAWQPLLWKPAIFCAYSWFPWRVVTLNSQSHPQQARPRACTHTSISRPWCQHHAMSNGGRWCSLFFKSEKKNRGCV